MRITIFLFCLLSCPFFCAAQTKPALIKAAGITGKLWRYKNFPSKIAEPRNVDVWLPENYSKNKKYAVLYMHDGQNLFDPTNAAGKVDWNIDGTLQQLIDENKVRETIVVGIWNTAHRIIEYAPQKPYNLVSHKNIKPSKYATPKFGESDKYLQFIVTELKPFIDKTYSTLTDRDNTFVMGSSMGGLMSIYAVSEYPEIFGGAACLSTQFPLGDGIILGYLEKFLPAPSNHKIYFDYGTKSLDAGYESYQKKADEIMRRKGYEPNKNWITMKFPGAGHSAIFWRKRVDIPIVFLLKK